MKKKTEEIFSIIMCCIICFIIGWQMNDTIKPENKIKVEAMKFILPLTRQYLNGEIDSAQICKELDLYLK